MNANLVRDLVLEPADNQRLANLCGQFDEHLKQIERRLGVQLGRRGNLFQLEGPAPAVEATERLLVALFEQAAEENITPQLVHTALQESGLYATPDEHAPGRCRSTGHACASIPGNAPGWARARG